MVHIRPATERDLPALQRIELQASALFPAGTLPRSLAGPMPLTDLQHCLAASALWVAEEPGGGPVGFVAARSHGSGHGSALHLLEMDVLPGRGRQGIGRRLLVHLCREAGRRGHTAVTLTTFAHLPWNAPFYARHGFRVLADGGEYVHLAAALRAERDSGLLQRVAMVRPAG